MHKDRKLQKQRTKSEGDLRDVIAQLSPRGSSVGPARPPSVFESAATSLKLRAHRERVLWTPTANALRLRAASSSHDVAPLVSRRTQSLVNVGPPDPLWADRRALSNPVSRHASIPSMVFSDFNQDANSPRVATPPSGPSTVAGSAASSPLVTRTPPRLGQSAPGSDVGSSPRLGVDSPLASERAPRGRFGRPALSCVVPSDGLRGGGGLTLSILSPDTDDGSVAAPVGPPAGLAVCVSDGGGSRPSSASSRGGGSRPGSASSCAGGRGAQPPTPAHQKMSQRKLIAMYDTIISHVAPGIALGADAAARDLAALKAAGVTHVVNCAAAACGNYHEGDLTYLPLSLQDSLREDISACFYDALEFIDDAIGDGGRLQLGEGTRSPRGNVVFVHCQHGVSRSATIVLAYLIWRRALNYEEALEAVRAARPTINPNIGFACSLLQWRTLTAGPPQQLHAWALQRDDGGGGSLRMQPLGAADGDLLESLLRESVDSESASPSCLVLQRGTQAAAWVGKAAPPQSAEYVSRQLRRLVSFHWLPDGAHSILTQGDEDGRLRSLLQPPRLSTPPALDATVAAGSPFGHGSPFDSPVLAPALGVRGGGFGDAPALPPSRLSQSTESAAAAAPPPTPGARARGGGFGWGGSARAVGGTARAPPLSTIESEGADAEAAALSGRSPRKSPREPSIDERSADEAAAAAAADLEATGASLADTMEAEAPKERSKSGAELLLQMTRISALQHILSELSCAPPPAPTRGCDPSSDRRPGPCAQAARRRARAVGRRARAARDAARDGGRLRRSLRRPLRALRARDGVARRAARPRAPPRRPRRLRDEGEDDAGGSAVARRGRRAGRHPAGGGEQRRRGGGGVGIMSEIIELFRGTCV